MVPLAKQLVSVLLQKFADITTAPFKSIVKSEPITTISDTGKALLTRGHRGHEQEFSKAFQFVFAIVLGIICLLISACFVYGIVRLYKEDRKVHAITSDIEPFQREPDADQVQPDYGSVSDQNTSATARTFEEIAQDIRDQFEGYEGNVSYD
ncbi:MAG: hypothetical protein MMC33_009846 [Icmadophila ericetorum]|nr:hypothetical protein [Icmadophila ericetorum]